MIYRLLAKLLAVPWVTDWIIQTALPHVYFHLPGYMNRFWLFNAYDPTTHQRKYPWFPYSVRVHHILRKDYDDHKHDHPWEFRTFVLKGWYVEQRECLLHYYRTQGTTATMQIGDYHSIRDVSPGGVWTLVILGRRQDTWGFKVDGEKVPAHKYLKSRDDARPPQ